MRMSGWKIRLFSWKMFLLKGGFCSILYADIVGFTAISSTYCAQDLVKILNELFARFDRLAEKYQQLRIKILGDCKFLNNLIAKLLQF